MTVVWYFTCEYDIGQDGLVFTSLPIAEKHAKTMVRSILDTDYEDMMDEGLLSFDTKELLDE